METPSITEAEKPVLAALREAGVEVEHVGDLMNRNDIDYRHAIPVLIQQMKIVSHPMLKEWLVRALIVPWARPLAAQPLIEEWDKSDDDNLKWVIGAALETVADDSVRGQLMAIAQDRSHGAARR